MLNMNVIADNRKSVKVVRNSGIELLKLFAIVIIIISHIVQTLKYDNHLYYIDYSIVSPNIQYLLLAFMRSFGAWGNLIFFICSAWFFVDSKSYSKKKWLYLLIEVWVVSVLILSLMMVFNRNSLSLKDIVYSLFPTTFSNNWYLTCYLLFYPIHPLLNKIIHSCNKKQLLRIAIVMFFIYYIINFIHAGHFEINSLVLWIATYFIVAYMKLYLKDFCINRKINIIMFIVSFTLYLAIYIIINILGLKIEWFKNKMLYFTSSYNPFWLVCSLTLFILLM